jgi:hypothetical protein
MTGPEQECDIILRGGLTSGVIYPGTLVALARHYRFRQVGGASAGAIAAGMAAAAEFGRQSELNPKGFERIAAMPTEISGGKTDFVRFFQPAPGQAALMQLIWALLDARAGRGGLLHGSRPIAGAVMAAFPAAAAAIGATLALAVAGGILLATGRPTVAAIALLAALLLLAISIAAVVLAGVGVSAALRETGFGLTAGINPALADSQDPEAYIRHGGFADWMHAAIQQASGKPFAEPLLVGDLWDAGKGADDDHSSQDRPRIINLMLTTTNLAHQLPHQFPFLDRPRMVLHFREEELRRVLPAPVVSDMVRRAGPPAEGVPPGYLPLPAPPDLPVLLGIRMSLSFPLLIAAVPLHAWDEGLEEMEACLFSDGGITSNFPVSSFDAPLPICPTFGINLDERRASAHSDGLVRPTDEDLVFLPEENDEAIKAPLRSNLRTAGILDFLGAIVDTARNAAENELLTMPGYRDRIVTIQTLPEEGGLNLNMPPETIEGLAARGGLAGNRLVALFHPAGAGPSKRHLPGGWANHRWLRFRLVMAAQEAMLRKVAHAWRHPQADGRSYEQTVADADPRGAAMEAARANLPRARWPAPGYELASSSAWHAARDRSAEYAAMAQAWTDAGDPTIFDGRPDGDDPARRDHGAPRPRVGLRLRPTGSRDPHLG